MFKELPLWTVSVVSTRARCMKPPAFTFSLLLTSPVTGRVYSCHVARQAVHLVLTDEIFYQNTTASGLKMLPQQKDEFLKEEFGRPVESIMRCEDFKSNFARRLSNRYISRSQVSGSRQDAVLKLCPTEKQETLNKVPERIEQRSQLLKNNNLEQNGENVKPPDKTFTANADMRHTEVNALNMEVDTLRWQLAQTEANRQMHIALLQQIVTFLNRVKEHIECQKNEANIKMGSISPSVMQRSLNISDLPRSRSVLHVGNYLDYSLTPSKKMSTRKMSKSINNVNGYRDCSSIWNQTKLPIVPENETGQKLTEEMSRLITLANTVLSTKIPDLACACLCNRNESVFHLNEHDIKEEPNIPNGTEAFKSANDNIVLNSSCDRSAHNGITNEFGEIKNRILDDFIVSQSSLSFGLENDSSDIKSFGQEQQYTQNGRVTSCGKVFDKRNEYNVSSNFIEDESGFSSMSSFQEIGIPIINIIPPSPCKENNYLEDIDETEKWKADTIELDKQSVKVFWV